MNKMSDINFISEFQLHQGTDAFIAIIPSVSSKETLLEELNNKCAFPYFGYNWDALWDLFCDFHWIEKRKIMIYHQGITELSYKDLVSYVRIIVNACKEWEECSHHYISFLFKTDEEEIIQNVISNLNE